MENVKISVDTVNKILQYLGNKPYIEVAGLVYAIQQEITQREEMTKISDDNLPKE